MTTENKLKPTPEQVAICNSTAQVMKIKAGAGTGKTTTLRGLAARNRDSRILYLAFNRSVKQAAQGRFAANVKVMTAHGLAFSRVGKDYAEITGKIAPDLKPQHVLPILVKSTTGMPPALHNLYAARVAETVKNFLVSADPEIATDHLSLGSSPGESKYFDPGKLQQDALKTWSRMIDLSSDVPMLHDGYLKLFALTNPDLRYDMVMLDEAQDTNPVLQHLVAQQSGRKVYVGDEHQAIYGFRGARNAMAEIQADQDFMLTASFRFGPRVAEVANAILAAKGETELRLQGLGPNTRMGPPPAAFTVLARSNAALFAQAVVALTKGQDFGFVGPLQAYRLDLIRQTSDLMFGKPVRDPFLKSFKNYDALSDYAEAMDDREWKARIGLANKHGLRLPALVESIEAKAWPQEANPNVLLTSAHRAKGLEFGSVVMVDDFLDFFDEQTGFWRDLENASPGVVEDVNLQYVAVTRAMHTLQLNEKLQRFMDRPRTGAAKPPSC